MPFGIAYDTLKRLNVSLGKLDDYFTILSTPDGAEVELDTNGGSDTVNVAAINGLNTINTGAGSDTVNVTTTANRLVDSSRASSGNGSSINGPLVVNGGGAAADRDELNFTSVFAPDEPGNLTSTELTGLDMLNGIAYSELEAFNVLFTASSSIEFTIESTHGGTTSLTTGDGADLIRVKTIRGATVVDAKGGNDTVNVFNDDSQFEGVGAPSRSRATLRPSATSSTSATAAKTTARSGF